MSFALKGQNAIPITPRGLHPITPNHSNRYTKNAGLKSQPRTRTIKAGFNTRHRDLEPEYTPQGWTSHTQAEGQLYFYRSDRRFLTEANVRKPENDTQISRWMLCIEKAAEAQQLPMTESIEIMLQPDLDDENTCGYYIVDHATQSISWLEDVSTDDLDMLPSVSDNHLRWAFNELYWLHVEYFSAHIAGISMSCVRELMSILSHARADHLTSTVGTFPYSADQCRDFNELLRDHVSSSEVLTDNYIICVVARLWSQVARNRFLNFYGEENARLSRDQYITTEEPSDGPFLLKALAKTVLFNIPSHYSKELNLLWVDRVVYVGPWQDFFSKTLSAWNNWAAWLMAFMFIHAFFYFADTVPEFLSVTSLALTLVGLATTILLINMHRFSNTFETEDAAAYLDALCHPSHGFALLGFIFSLPKALLYWSALLAIGEAASMSYSSFHITTNYLMLAAIIALAAFASSRIISHRKSARCTDTEHQDSYTQISIEGRV